MAMRYYRRDTFYNTHLEIEAIDSQAPADERDCGPIGGRRRLQRGPWSSRRLQQLDPSYTASLFGSLNAASFSDALTEVKHRGPTSLGIPTRSYLESSLRTHVPKGPS